MSRQMLILGALALAFSGCKKDDEEPAPAPPASTDVTFKIEYGFHWGADDFDLANTYTDGNSNAVQFTTVKFYMGQPELFNAGSEVVDYHDKYLLFSAATPEGEQAIGIMGAATVDEFRFILGLDSADNHADPTLAGAPLNDATMHWNWNPSEGYKFLVLEGLVDDDGTGIVEADDPMFTYHCATDTALREAIKAYGATVAAGGTLAPHMEVRMDLLVTGVDMLAIPMGMGYEPINAQLMDNWVDALEIE